MLTLHDIVIANKKIQGYTHKYGWLNIDYNGSIDEFEEFIISIIKYIPKDTYVARYVKDGDITYQTTFYPDHIEEYKTKDKLEIIENIVNEIR